MAKYLRIRWLGVAALALACAGCTATFRDPRVPAGEERSSWQSYFLVGAIGEAEVDVRDYCPTGRASEVVIGENALTLGVSVVTLGIYTPRRVLITCEAAPGRAR